MKIVLDVSVYQSVAQLDHLLKNAPDEIVGVIIKATQGLSYSDSLADAFAAVCESHNTAYGYYDFLTNDQVNVEEAYFKDFVSRLKHNKPQIKPTCDMEGAYNKFAAGEQHWEDAYGGSCIGYGPLSTMPKYASMNNPKWVAQYDSMSYYRPQQSEIDAYAKQGYAMWQFTDSYLGLSQDASVLLTDFSVLRA